MLINISADYINNCFSNCTLWRILEDFERGFWNHVDRIKKPLNWMKAPWMCVFQQSVEFEAFLDLWQLIHLTAWGTVHHVRKSMIWQPRRHNVFIIAYIYITHLIIYIKGPPRWNKLINIQLKALFSFIRFKEKAKPKLLALQNELKGFLKFF